MAAKAAGIVPVLCVGETLEEREAGQTEARIAEQLDANPDLIVVRRKDINRITPNAEHPRLWFEVVALILNRNKASQHLISI